MKLRVIITLFLSVFFIVGCSNTNINNNETKQSPETNDVKELIAKYSGDFTTEESASVTGTELIITDETGKENSYPLPEDEFFVSIAPFKDITHPCTNHSLTGCQGELEQESFDIYIADSEGNIVIEEKLMTGENGFIDLWLPRNEQFNITISQGNEQAKAEITTYDESPTCITTMQLL